MGNHDEDTREVLRLATFTRKEGREEIRWTVEEFMPPSGTVVHYVAGGSDDSGT